MHSAFNQREEEEGEDRFNYSGMKNFNPAEREEALTDSSNGWQQGESAYDPGVDVPPQVTPNPDRAISIVSELKSNAALFAAFAYGSLNLPSTLTVSESKVTSVTTSLSVSRPLPDSDLIRTFVVLDVCTLCLMISCVAASQLLIYRLTDGSYEDIDENYRSKQMRKSDKYDGSWSQKNSRDSALGRLVTTYRNEFTVARLTFDLGLVSLLLAVGVRSLAIFDEDIVVPVAFVIGTTTVFLAVAYFTTYVEVFRTAENLTESQLPFPFSTNTNKTGRGNVEKKSSPNRENQITSQIFLPISLVSVVLALFFSLNSGSESSGLNLYRLGPYDVTSGASKLKVVAEKIDSEKGKSDPKGKSQRSREQNQRNSNSPKERFFNTSKKSRTKTASEKLETESAKKKVADEETKKKAEEEARKKAEDEAAAAKAKAEDAADAAKKRNQEEAAIAE